jgi:hypothetical protein
MKLGAGGGAVKVEVPRNRRGQFLSATVTSVTSLALVILVLFGCAAPSGSSAPPLSSSATGAMPSLNSSGSVRTGGTASGSASTGQAARQRPGLISVLFHSIRRAVSCAGSSTIWVSAGTRNTNFTVDELDSQNVCFSDLDFSSSPTLLVITPSGAQRTIEITVLSSSLLWILNPGPGTGPIDTKGNYSFELLAPPSGGSGSVTSSPSASQSTASILGESGSAEPPPVMVASGNFTVAQATEPAAETISGLITVGQQIFVSLAGFPANSTVFMSLYGPSSSSPKPVPVFADLPAIITSGTGEALLQWVVPSGAPPGYYGLLIDPPPATCTAVEACFVLKIDS